MNSRVALSAALTVLTLHPGCSPEKNVELFVDLRTDLLAGREFHSIDVFVQVPGSLTPLREEVTVSTRDTFWDGNRIAEFGGLGSGAYRVVVHLRDGEGTLVAERPASIRLRRSQVVTIVITRDCRDVTCDDPSRTACLQGQCVAETCTPETPESCPSPSCSTADDCTAPAAACAEPHCTEGICFARPTVPETCSGGTYCDAEEGCLPEEGGPVPSCSDRIANGGETGIDCGGSCAPCTGLCAGVVEIPVSECQALEALYISTDGTNWTTNLDWLLTATPCSWHGVACATGHVSRLDLATNNLVGTVPPELGNLSGLTQLLLGSNQLTGPIPPELGNLSSLVLLSFTSNQLTGSIPPAIGNLVSLTGLSMNSNQLIGSLPPELGNLTGLSNLNMANNMLTGPIPREFGSLINLTTLMLHFNQLSGPVPAELGNFPNLVWLILNDNQLSGPIPPELGGLSSLTSLLLDANELTSVAPNTFGRLSAMGEISLSNNMLDEASVDETLLQVYEARSSYTFAGPQLHLSGNAAPSGSTTDPAVVPGTGATNFDWSWNGICHNPDTGQALAYTLQNDPCTDGFNSWGVDFTP